MPKASARSRRRRSPAGRALPSSSRTAPVPGPDDEAALLCVGDLALDLAVTITDAFVIGSDTAGTIEMHGGGSAANVAAWAASVDTPARFIGAVGNDRTGDFLIHELAGHGVDVRPIRRTGERTRSIAVIVGRDGNRSMVSDQNTVVAPSLDDYDASWFEGVAWLHLTAYTYTSEFSRPLFGELTRAANAKGIPYSVDPSAAQLLRNSCVRSEVLRAFEGASVLFPSHDEAEYLTGLDDPRAAAVELLGLAECVAVTCGQDGAHIAHRERAPFHIAALSTTQTNSLGCGDAFAAGFVAGRMSGRDLDASAELAVTLAARALALPGAR